MQYFCLSNLFSLNLWSNWFDYALAFIKSPLKKPLFVDVVVPAIVLLWSYAFLFLASLWLKDYNYIKAIRLICIILLILFSCLINTAVTSHTVHTLHTNCQAYNWYPKYLLHFWPMFPTITHENISRPSEFMIILGNLLFFW